MNPVINQAQFDQLKSVQLTDAPRIRQWFMDRTGMDFIPWFNAKIGVRTIGLRSTLPSSANDGFSKLWNNISVIYGRDSVNIFEFVALTSIVTNETGGTFAIIEEAVNPNTATKANSGIAYAYNTIRGTKRSYNTLSGNKTCFQLFNDPDYLAAFDTLPTYSNPNLRLNRE